MKPIYIFLISIFAAHSAEAFGNPVPKAYRTNNILAYSCVGNFPNQQRNRLFEFSLYHTPADAAQRRLLHLEREIPYLVDVRYWWHYPAHMTYERLKKIKPEEYKDMAWIPNSTGLSQIRFSRFLGHKTNDLRIDLPRVLPKMYGTNFESNLPLRDLSGTTQFTSGPLTVTRVRALEISRMPPTSVGESLIFPSDYIDGAFQLELADRQYLNFEYECKRYIKSLCNLNYSKPACYVEETDGENLLPRWVPQRRPNYY